MRTRYHHLLVYLSSLIFLLGAGAEEIKKAGESYKQVEQRLQKQAERMQEVTVSILGTEGASGTGAIVSADGLVLTCGHVVARPNCYILIRLADGEFVKAKTLGLEKGADVGLCKIIEEAPKGGWPYVKLGDSKAAKVGDWVCLAGYHGGSVKGRRASLRLGKISNSKPFVIQADVAICPGDSGGPLFDKRGEVIGVVSNVGTHPLENNFVPSQVFKDVWDELKSGKVLKEKRGGMLDGMREQGGGKFTNKNRAGKLDGYVLGSLKKDRKEQLKQNQIDARSLRKHMLKVYVNERQVGYATLLGDRAYTKASLLKGAVSVRSMTGRYLDCELVRKDTASDVAELKVAGLKPVALKVRKEVTVGTLTLSPIIKSVRLGVVGHKALPIAKGHEFDKAVLQRAFWGMYPIQPHKDSPPVIGDILKNSPAQVAGLQKGDKVLSIEGLKVTRWGDVVGVLRFFDPGAKVEIVFQREGKQMSKKMQLVVRGGKPKHSVDDGKTDFFTKSVGGVSKRRTGFRSVLEHDVMTRPELCGGPVFDLSGALIGMNIARYDRGSTYVLPVTAFRKGL